MNRAWWGAFRHLVQLRTTARGAATALALGGILTLACSDESAGGTNPQAGAGGGGGDSLPEGGGAPVGGRGGEPSEDAGGIGGDAGSVAESGAAGMDDGAADGGGGTNGGGGASGSGDGGASGNGGAEANECIPIEVEDGCGTVALVRVPSPSVGDRPRSLATADFDGDGKLDLAATDVAHASSVSVLINQGRGAFAPAVFYPVGDGPYWVVAADFTGDSAPDLATADRDSARVSVLVNQGDGTFASAVDYVVGAGPYGLVAADVDGDGQVDLVSANSNATSVSVLLNQGGVFAPAVAYGTGTPPTAVTALDFNGDGKTDLATANFTFGPGAPGNISLLLNLGSGTFGEALPIANGIKPAAITTADINADARPDLIFTHDEGSQGSVHVLLNPGDGPLSPARTFPVGKAPSALTAADLDGDGAMDLAVANELSDSVSVLLGSGDGEFQAVASITGGSGPSAISAVDLDGDCSIDLAVTNYYMSDVSLLLNSGQGTFASPTAYSTSASPRVVKAVDVNTDGLPDMVTVGFRPVPEDKSNLEVRLNLGAGTFGAPVNYPVTGAYALDIGDLNDDGYDDLVAASPIEGSVSVSLNNGDGTFAAPVHTVTASPIDVAVADVDRDGSLDVVYVTNVIAEGIGVLLNLGDGVLAPPVLYPVQAGGGTESLATADFDADGWPDLAFPDEYSETLTLSFNQGDGNFAAPVELAVPPYLREIRTADVNDDDRPDIVLTRGSSVVILLNRGDRSFAPAVEYPGTRSFALWSTEAVDLDGDGALDLASPTSIGIVSVRFNRGDGTFDEASYYDGHAYALSLAAADLNEDGRSDLLVANTELNAVTVLLNSCSP